MIGINILFLCGYKILMPKFQVLYLAVPFENIRGK